MIGDKLHLLINGSFCLQVIFDVAINTNLLCSIELLCFGRTFCVMDGRGFVGVTEWKLKQRWDGFVTYFACGSLSVA